MNSLMPLTALRTGEEGTIIKLDGGHTFQRKLRTLGIREGKRIGMVTKEPIGGPVVVEAEGMRITVGRGMAQKILVEK